jgi:lysophospholipase L1-like esterase
MPAAGWAQQRGECNRTPLPDKIFKALEAGKFQTVVVYGTSVTINGQWSKEMEAYFETLYPGQVNFFNSAKAGMHSNWGVKNLKERVLDKKPDLVFLEFSINDAATKHGISIQNSQRNLDTMVRMLREQNPQAELVLQTMNPAWDSPHVSKTYGSDRPNLEDYYEVNRRYARVHELPLVDNYLVWKKIMDEEPERYQEMVPDGIHPNSGPSREIAWLTIKELLDRARALAGGDLIVNVWPEGKMPGTHADFPESLRSPERTDAIRITNISEPTLTLFPVKGISDSAPAMIVCPGGGYSYVGVDKEGSDIAK